MAISYTVTHDMICHIQDTLRVMISVRGLAKKVAGHQGLQLKKVVGPDEKL